MADRLEAHRLRSGNPQAGPIFRTSKGTAENLNNVLHRQVLPALNRCERCRKSEDGHDEDHEYKRDESITGWHAARRGLGSNLYRLHVPEMVIQRILRHANVTTTNTYYIKTMADDVKGAMQTLENAIPDSLSDTYRTLN